MKALFLAIVLMFAVPVLAEEVDNSATVPAATVADMQRLLDAKQLELEQMKAAAVAQQRQIDALNAAIHNMKAANNALQTKLTTANNELLKLKGKGAATTPAAAAKTPEPTKQYETVVLADIIAGMPASIPRDNSGPSRLYVVEKTRGKIVTITGKVSFSSDDRIMVMVLGLPAQATGGQKTVGEWITVDLSKSVTAEQMAASQGKVITISALCTGGIYHLVQQKD